MDLKYGPQTPEENSQIMLAFTTFKKHLVTLGVFCAVIVVGSVAVPRSALAQAIKAALVRDADLPARQPFQRNIIVNLNDFSYQNIPIPTGKRLVLEYVSVSGGAASTQGGVQPIILINSSVAGSPQMNFYLDMTQSVTAPMQFYKSEVVKIYADTLAIGFGYSGYTPYQLAAQVQISGHLVDITY